MANQELQTTGNGGTLQISAFSPGRGRPAPDTAVNVRNDRGELVFSGITDSSGFLPPFVLPAPPAELSLEPTALKQGDPFSSYDLTAVSALGERTDITGVQIYSGNFLGGRRYRLRDGSPEKRRGGFCLETEAFPDSANRREFTDIVMEPGRTYRSRTLYAFVTG